MAPVEVYGMQASAPCRIVEMTAEVLGIEYEFKVVDLMAGDNMKPEYLAMNPMHNIPTMKDGDFCLNESRAIAAYLVNKYGKDDSLYPKETVQRAIVDQRMYFDMGAFYKAFGDCVYPVMFGGPLPGEDKTNKLKEVLGWVNDWVKDGKFAAGGDKLTLADICLVATYSTIKASGILENIGTFCNLDTWAAKVATLVPNYAKANQEGADSFGAFYAEKVKAGQR